MLIAQLGYHLTLRSAVVCTESTKAKYHPEFNSRLIYPADTSNA